MRTVPENVTCGRKLLSNQWLPSSSPGLRRIFSIAVMQTRCKVQTLKIRADPKLSGLTGQSFLAPTGEGLSPVGEDASGDPERPSRHVPKSSPDGTGTPACGAAVRRGQL